MLRYRFMSGLVIWLMVGAALAMSQPPFFMAGPGSGSDSAGEVPSSPTGDPLTDFEEIEEAILDGYSTGDVRGLGNSLRAKLRNIRAALEASDWCDAEDKLAGLRGEVAAQEGFRGQGRVGIESSLAQSLLAKIDSLSASLQCDGPSGSIDFAFVDSGFVSYYRYGDGTFTGGCLAIRNNQDWTDFWDVHTSGHSTPPPLPAVDFSEDMVLVCILGFVSDCCQSYVEIVEIWATDGDYDVSVVRHYESGMATMVTNPYHIVTTKRTDGTVSFHDDATNVEIPQIPPVP